ncbi:MAG: DUF1846 domain-containing protein [Spirochaetales bacterium]|nr:DUF1846 domain-containing protein [Spirochaetales bacterium]
MKKTGFDNEKYLAEQKNMILERVHSFNNKLYLEFGGKLMFDYHAARVLPGYDPNVKMRLLQNLSDSADIILCIFAGDIERKKVRADFGITYDADALKIIDDLKDWGIAIRAVVITRFENQPGAVIFKNKLERRGIRVYTHRYTRGYPTDVDLVVSKDGYGANEYIETENPLVVVTGPGPGSGKMATCLSQVYHEHVKGIESGYAKFETFPIWNIPLKHPVNIAYEAATADIGDFNLIDPFHHDAYGKVAINYNRDVETYPVLKRILEKIGGTAQIYKSPTEMGVNCAGSGILDNAAVCEAGRQEIIRRYFRYSCEYVLGFASSETVQRAELLMDELSLKPEDRTVVIPARNAATEAQEKGKGNKGIYCGAALELEDGTIITGKNSPMFHATSSVIINTIKKLSGIPESIHLLPPQIVESIRSLKGGVLGAKSLSLDLEETLIALSISATTNPAAHAAMGELKKLANCEMHMTHIPTPGDEAGLRKLGINLTADPNFSSNYLFIS